jgi:hypothetical protein
MGEEKYFWAANYNLGGRKSPVEPGDELPKRYNDDPRLPKWIRKGFVSTVKPSNEAKFAKTIEDLELQNLELQSKLKVKIDKLKDLEDSSKAYEKAQAQLDKLMIMMMDNEKIIADGVKVLREDRVDKKERLDVADLLEALPKLEDNEA